MKIIVWKKRAATVLAGVLALCMVGYLAAYPLVARGYAADRPLPIYSVETDQKVCAISFDAAWGDVLTQDLVDTLEEYHVQATFFVIGKWAEQYPEDVKMLFDAGMEVMSHSYAHDHMPQLSPSDIAADLERCNAVIEKLTGARPTLFRFPYGDYDNASVDAVRQTGLEPVQWDVDSLDWKGISAEEITQRVLDKVQPGSIILFHNAAEHTPEALPGILSSLQSQGYRILPVSQLLLPGVYQRDFTIDHTGRQMALKEARA